VPPILISSPSKFATEQWLHVDLAGTQGGQGGADLVVVSGYAFYDDEQLIGDPDGDNYGVAYVCQLLVGPVWLRIKDVSPIATLAGYYHESPDSVDKIGYDINSCTWDLPEPAPKKIRLSVALSVWGGEDHTLERIAYHLVARGKLAPGQDFAEN
jgi:hypothetical protein